MQNSAALKRYLKSFITKKLPAFIASSFGLMLLTCFTASPCGAEMYGFERLWPTLPQPWYFNYPVAVSVDAQGNVYVADNWNHKIQKLTSDGKFIAAWGKSGSGNGEFSFPGGVAAGASGFVYIADTWNNRIQKFTESGLYVSSWGSPGTGSGQFSYPKGVAVDIANNVYVVDSSNSRVQKFNQSGSFISGWGKKGTGSGEFDTPSHIAADANGNIYVTDTNNHRVQKFSSGGTFILQWGGEGSQNGRFKFPGGIAATPDGSVLVVDTWNHRVQKFSSEGVFIKAWGSEGTATGECMYPAGIAVDAKGYIYLADAANHRIQKYTSRETVMVAWESRGTRIGEFINPSGLALDQAGYVYVSDSGNNRVQQFTEDGLPITSWGGKGSGEGQFDYPTGLAFDAAGNLYVADTNNNRVQIFSSDGSFLSLFYLDGEGAALPRSNIPTGIAIDKAGSIYIADPGTDTIKKYSAMGSLIKTIGSSGSGKGQFKFPAGIAVDDQGSIYVADSWNNRIQKLTSAGAFVKAWGSKGSETGKFDSPFGIAADKEGNIFVADTNNHRIQKFSSDGTFSAAAGDLGRYPNQMSFPCAIALSSTDKIFACDTDNNRLQVFRKLLSSVNKKAIIVAGGGPYKSNYLWDATQTCANLAYRSLTFQGFSKETIYYMMSNMYQDLDNNGKYDDVDSDATSAALEYAITDWAASADDVVIYLTDHGGDAVFRISENETVAAAKIGAWIDKLQDIIPGKVVVVYDACRSGSFLPALASFGSKERIVITSASENEDAYFINNGAVSFSFYFWGFILNGASLYEAFLSARDSMESYQTALLDDNGNGIGNEERIDGSLARNYSVGNGVVTGGDIPVIQAISSEQTLQGESSAKIWVSGIVDAGAIVRTWGVVLPPDVTPQSGEKDEVIDLPFFELEKTDEQLYEAEYEEFKSSGTYRISVYTMDEEGNTSLPVQTEVTQTKGEPSCPAVLLSGGNKARIDLIRKFRDDILQKSATGTMCINLFYEHSAELSLILVKNPAIYAQAKNDIDMLAKSVKAFLECGEFTFPDNFEQEANSLMALISAKAGANLKNDISILQKTFVQNSIRAILDDIAE